MQINVPTVAERQRDWEDMSADESKLLLSKGADYTAGQQDVDAYANFRIIAELLEGAPITPYTVAMIYALKHVFSLITFAKTGKQESGEGLRGRHMDVRNYFFILNELVPDHVNFFTGANLVSMFREGDEEYPTVMNENGSEYWDDTKLGWYPIADLDSREEVNNTTSKGCVECSGYGKPWHEEKN